MTRPVITQSDIAGLLAVAEFLDAMRQEAGLETEAPEQLRDLAERLASFIVIVP